MVSSGWRALVVLLVLVMLVMAGCSGLPGQNIAEVTGRVTLEGKPVAGVVLQFEPDESGVAPGKKARPVAFGQTDTDGRYRAFRTGNKQFGAAVGLSHVRITVPEGSAAKVHPRYMGDSTFWHEIGPGATVIDLELVADPTAVRRQSTESTAE
jgi:hypothetical protein